MLIVPEHYGNRFLSFAEMTDNANLILTYMMETGGWTRNAVCGMLGNMQSESTINPGIWQNLNPNTSNGFGLVQWTPATKYLNWAYALGYTTYDEYGRLLPNLLRILYELDNGQQWGTTSQYPISFATFAHSTQSPEYLAQAFLYNYEKPANINQPARSTQARYWFDNLDGDPGIVDPDPDRKRRSKIFLWLFP